MKKIPVKLRINKANGQINFSAPKKKLPKEIKDSIDRAMPSAKKFFLEWDE